MRKFLGGALVALLLLAPAARAEEGALDAYRISGPVTHDNLAIYLVHGKSAPGPVPLTLQEALAQGKAKVHEKGNVNELEIENVGDKEVFVQAGDIVKGGQQDRVLSVSLIVPPRSGRMPIAAFCVEPGRWTKRGAEDAKNFGSADAMMPSKQSKLVMAKPAPAPEQPGTPVKEPDPQQKVWSYVARIQGKLSANIGAPVAAPLSQSSLELSLENKSLEKAEAPYVSALKPAGESDDDVVGYVMAVNGKLATADLYPSNGLFRKMWPKLLRASVTEALADKDGTAPAAAMPSTADAQSFLDRGGNAPASTSKLTREVSQKKRETADMLSVETERRSDGSWLYRSYIAK
jgi:hypothetical protein